MGEGREEAYVWTLVFLGILLAYCNPSTSAYTWRSWGTLERVFQSIKGYTLSGGGGFGVLSCAAAFWRVLNLVGIKVLRAEGWAGKP